MATRPSAYALVGLGLSTALAACQPASGSAAPVQRLTTSADPAQPLMNVTQWNTSRLLAVDASGGIHAVFTQLGTTSIEYPINLPDPIATAQLPLGQVLYKPSFDGGHNWSAESPLTARAPGVDSPSIAAAGNSLYLSWRAVDAGRLRAWFRTSSDRGTTWSVPVAISDNPLGISASPPTLAVSPSGSSTSVYVVWSDARPQPVGAQVATTNEIYLASSQDDGNTWQPVRQVSQPDGYSSWTPTVAAAAGAVHVAWTDERDDTMECTKGGACHEEEYYRRSPDRGATWGPETRLTTDPPGAPKESWAPSLAAEDGLVHLAFFDKRSDLFQVYYKRSRDGGLTWDADVLLSSGHGPLSAVRPSLAVRAGSVHVAWFEFQDFPADINYRRSLDAGTTWDPPANLTQNFPSAARIPSVAVAPDHAAHVIWYDTRNSDPQGPRVEIYYARPNG